MASTNVSIGCEFRRDGINLVAVQRKGLSGVQVVAWGSVPLTPKGLFYEETEEQIASKIARFLSQHELRPGEAVIGLPRSSMILQAAEIPPVPDAEIRQIVTFDLERHIPVTADQVYFDAIRQATSGNQQMSVLLLACPKALFERYLSIFTLLGIPVHGVDLAAFGLLATTLQGRTLDEDFVGCVCDIDDETVELTFHRGGRLLYSRSVPIPERHRARDRENQTNADQDDWRLAEFLDEQIRMTSAALRLGTQLPELREIVLCFGQQHDVALPAMVNQLIGVPTNLVAPGANLNPPLHLSQQQSCVVARALGLALSVHDPRLRFGNLIPPENRIVRKESGLVLSGILSGMIAAFLLAMVAAAFWRQDLALSAVKARMDQISPQVDALVKAEREYEKLQKQMEAIQGVQSELPSKLEILRELTRILPDGESGEDQLVWLTMLRIEENEIQIRGLSESPEGIIEIMESSPFFEDVRFDSAISRNNFSIKAIISKGAGLTDEGLEDQFAMGAEEAAYGAEEGSETAPPETALPPATSASPTPIPRTAGETRTRRGGPAYRAPEPPPGEEAPLPPDTGAEEAMKSEESPEEPPPGEEAEPPPEEAGYSEEEAMARARKDLFDFLRNHQLPEGDEEAPVDEPETFEEYPQTEEATPAPYHEGGEAFTTDEFGMMPPDEAHGAEGAEE
jgi:Tfp pilus assembly PilM family ATPase/Tfp pilus assembly protein PilN